MSKKKYAIDTADVTPLTLQDVRGRARKMVREQEAEGEKEVGR